MRTDVMHIAGNMKANIASNVWEGKDSGLPVIVPRKVAIQMSRKPNGKSATSAVKTPTITLTVLLSFIACLPPKFGGLYKPPNP
jgi:hypothetical protein